MGIIEVYNILLKSFRYKVKYYDFKIRNGNPLCYISPRPPHLIPLNFFPLKNRNNKRNPLGSREYFMITGN